MLVTTLIGVIALATSTYTVVARIAKFEIVQSSNVTLLSELAKRTDALEKERLPTGIELGRLGVSLNSIQNSIDRLENKIERLQGLTKKASKD